MRIATCHSVTLAMTLSFLCTVLTCGVTDCRADETLATHVAFAALEAHCASIHYRCEPSFFTMGLRIAARSLTARNDAFFLFTVLTCVLRIITCHFVTLAMTRKNAAFLSKTGRKL